MGLISFDEAFALVVAEAQPLGSERVPLDQAQQRILAEPVVAMVDWPPADVSAMDGYAVRGDEAAALILVGQSFPAAPFNGVIGEGEAVRIFTGAEIPGGTGRIVMQENVSRDGERVEVPPLSGARHIRCRAGDFAVGDVLLRAGTRLTPLAMVAAAGADLCEVVVHRRARVTILGTGDELVAPGSARTNPGSIPESISFGVAGLVAEWGGETIARRRTADDLALITATAREVVAASDVVVVTGGASVGEKDFAKAAFAALGFETIFSKVAIKPGKPVWFGRVGTTLVIGLPGNPTSAMVVARLLLAPLVAGLAGGDPADAANWRSARLATSLAAGGERETFVRATWDGDAVAILSNQDSGAQSALSKARLLVRQRAGSAACQPGESVDILDF